MTRKISGANGSNTWPVLGGKGDGPTMKQLQKELQELKDTLKKGGKGQGKGPSAASKSWDCACGFHNFGFRPKCRECGKNKGQNNPGRAANQPGRPSGGNGGNPSPTQGKGKDGGTESEHEKKVSIAKAMLAAAKALPDGPQKETLISVWEDDLKSLKETERKTLPVGQQLKSSLDRVEARKKALTAAQESAKDLKEKVLKAEKEEAEASAALADEEAELQRLQQEAAKDHAADMTVDAEGAGGPPRQQEKIDMLEKKVEDLLRVFKTVMPRLPEEEQKEFRKQFIITPTAAPVAPPTGETDREESTAMLEEEELRKKRESEEIDPAARLAKAARTASTGK